MSPAVFAYGSLAGPHGRPARVRGMRRVWGVAMDNREAIPGYKRYLDPSTGEAPPLHVAFVDLAEDPGGTVDGVVLEVGEDELAALDRRERNYERVRVALEDGGAAWTYVGSAGGRRRLAEGRAAGTAVVARGYLELVGLDPGDLPVADLERQDL